MDSGIQSQSSPPPTATDVNELIDNYKSIDTNKVSDGYHTFGELYDHRIELFITLCRWLTRSDKHTNLVWRSKANSDGSIWDGWFLLGINKHEGGQITYHLPISKWDECDFADDTLEIAPPFDGHTSADVIERLKTL